MQTLPFGRTGHQSSRVIFGAAALGGIRQEKADQVLDLLLEFGVNHVDTASMYGDSELRIGPWMASHRKDFFLATKTIDRSYAGARDSIHRSLERLRVDHVDLIQLHSLVPEDEWRTAFAPTGALEAVVEAKEQGLARFVGVTGHGVDAARRHLQSLERYPFDSVLLPYNFSMMSQPGYAADFEALLAECSRRGVAVQTIKSVARRRWQEMPARRFSWYEPLRDPDAVRRAVHYVLARPGIFLNSSSDIALLRPILEAANAAIEVPSAAEMTDDARNFEVEPLFVPGGYQGTA